MNLKNKTIWFISPLLLFFTIVGFLTISVIFSSRPVDASSDLSSLDIYNERVQPFYSEAVLFSWETDKPATSKVVYGDTFGDGATSTINYGYEYSTKEVEALVTKHSMLITGLSQDIPYSFRPVSIKGDGLESVGGEKTITLTNSCTYLKSYLKIGEGNDTEEVKKLQTFLRDFEGFSELVVTGIFDQATFNAVSAFQLKYKEDILAPWGIDIPTGYVYYTTQKKINELYCNEEFLLEQDQLTEISNFYNFIIELPEGNTLDEIDFNLIGMEDAIFQGVSPKLSEPLYNESDIAGEEDEVIEGEEQTVKRGLLASVFSAAKNGISAVLNSFRSFFKRDKTQGEDLDLEEWVESENEEDADVD